MAEALTGRCLCGAVRWESTEAPLWQRFCHCESCRRNCAAPVAAFLAVPLGGFRWLAAVPAGYASSPGVLRRFCARCGTPVSYQNADLPGEIHLYAAALEHPSRFRPEGHDFWSEHLPWLELADALAREG